MKIPGSQKSLISGMKIPGYKKSPVPEKIYNLRKIFKNRARNSEIWEKISIHGMKIFIDDVLQLSLFLYWILSYLKG